VEVKIGNTKLILTIGDITESETESIVNAANSTCMGGAGVDGTIHSKGNPQILQECIKIRKTLYPDGLPPGETVITTGGNLKAKYVIHTVCPICNGPMTKLQKQILRNAYLNSLKLALEKNIKSISFPSISTGAYRCDVKEASKIALKAVIDFLKQNPNKLDLVAFVLFTREIYNVYKTSLGEILNANFNN
jgi:O-acetyl-ADP-ribose deacetylase (regulator of RNase III)